MHLIDLLGRPVRRRNAVVAAGVPLAAMLAADGRSHAGHAECHEAHADTLLALSEASGQIARMQDALDRVVAELEARQPLTRAQRALAAELRAIAHDTAGG